MADVPWATLLSLVLPDVKGCLDNIAEEKIRESAIEFCEESEAWREKLCPKTLIGGFSEYEVEPLSESRIAQVIDVEHNDKPVIHTSKEWLDANLRDWRTEKDDQIKYFYMESPKLIRVTPIPEVSQGLGLKIRCALSPSIGSTGLYQIVYDYYYQQIVSGAKALLMEMKDVKWSDPDKARFHRQIFERDKFKAKSEGARRFRRTDNTVLHTRAVW